MFSHNIYFKATVKILGYFKNLEIYVTFANTIYQSFLQKLYSELLCQSGAPIPSCSECWLGGHTIPLLVQMAAKDQLCVGMKDWPPCLVK